MEQKLINELNFEVYSTSLRSLCGLTLEKSNVNANLSYGFENSTDRQLQSIRIVERRIDEIESEDDHGSPSNLEIRLASRTRTNSGIDIRIASRSDTIKMSLDRRSNANVRVERIIITKER